MIGRNPLWEINTLQFPRLIAELEATGAFTDDVIAKVADEMDVTPDDVCELIDRAQAVWDQLKSPETRPGLSISDDDLCATCERLDYNPGATSFCSKEWPGEFDRFGYCVSCKSYKPAKLYLNHYRCADCDVTWEDEWSCMCNDRCPVCDTEIEPSRSEEIVTLERDKKTR